MEGRMRLSWILVLIILPSLAGADSFQSKRSRAERAVRVLARGRTLSVSWAVHRTRPVAIHGLAEASHGATPAERARGFLAAHQDLFVSGEQLALLDVQTAAGSTYVRFQQVHRGIPVDSAHLIVGLDGQGTVRSVSSEAEPLELASVKPGLDAAAAARAAATKLGFGLDVAHAASAELTILPLGGGRLAWRVLLPFPQDSSGRAHLIDAQSGAYVGSRRAAVIERPGKGVRP
jgi:Zn-dependent metalloprotease